MHHLIDALTSVLVLVLESIEFPFEGFDPQRLRVHSRFSMRGAFLGGHAVLPALFHHLDHANDPFLKCGIIICNYGQCRMLCLWLVRACLLIVIFGLQRSRRGIFLEDREIVCTYG